MALTRFRSVAKIRSGFEDPHGVAVLWIFRLKDSIDQYKGQIACEARGEEMMKRIFEDEWDAYSHLVPSVHAMKDLLPFSECWMPSLNGIQEL